MREQLFRDLYAAHSRQLYSYLLGRTGNRDSAADLLQDVFLKVWNRIELVAHIPNEERIYWLFSVATNRLTDYYRSVSYRKKAEQQLQADCRRDDGDLSAVLAGRERFRELESHIMELPEELRCILLMKAAGGMNSSQIGRALHQPPGTIRYKIALARRLLADKLGLPTKEEAGKRRERNWQKSTPI
ncbi:hypothetical protein SD70_27475 [Gordoniibacillus kamchatkensis]|uniref:RNA polymerase sigma factor n=1 Tax=Gordoniibacillus kamchatkensis TaxID=1590651 RepID=A0ABR5AB97_9BACL|nr:RNA polymerase sigma factor [Paenibacillus sp. VKM B-2647]KIL38267.1 hypothetical protein SD70_27475 [Paenibacillus sp. VKM B-2647]